MDENILKKFFADTTGIRNWLYKEITNELNKNLFKIKGIYLSFIEKINIGSVGIWNKIEKFIT